MKATRSSTTAEQMALSRAIETRKPAGERICCDPLAERFLGPKYRMLLWGRPFRDVARFAVCAGARLFAQVGAIPELLWDNGKRPSGDWGSSGRRFETSAVRSYRLRLAAGGWR